MLQPEHLLVFHSFHFIVARGRPATPMLHDFAQQLQANRDRVVDRWVEAVRRDPKLVSANKLNHQELRDHLGLIVTALAGTLRSNPHLRDVAEEPALAPEAKQGARLHGQTRWQQDYRVDELVREISVIRSELLEIFSEYLRSCRQIETDDFLRTTQVVHGFFDEICMTSVACYVQAREEQAENTRRGLVMLNEAMSKQHEVADVSRRRTLSTVAHEMATPVNALGLGVTYLAESEDPAERREAKQIIGRTLEHLRTMLDQLLDFARMDGGSEKPVRRAFEVRPLFEYLVASCEPLASAKRLHFHMELDPQLVSVTSDENKVQRIGLNLLSNAVKYTDHGEVSLRLRVVSDTFWSMEVSDTGSGIPAEHLDRVFREFQRLAAHDDRPGLGLGLAIVRNLADCLGGEVKVLSEMGKGSRFTVLLPRG